MKILLIHQFFILPNEPGGSRHIELIKHWRKKNHQVSVVAGSTNYMTNRSKLPLGRITRKQTVDGIPIRWIYNFPILHWGLIGRLFNYLSFFIFSLSFVLKEKPDIIIATSPPPSVGLLGFLLSRRRRVPWVLEVRDLWPEVAIETGLNLKTPLSWIKIFTNFLYRRATVLVTLSWGLEKALQETGTPHKKIITIPNGVDDFFVTPLDKESSEFKKFKSIASCIIIYVGAMGLANQTSTIIQLAEKMSHDSRFYFLLAGDGRERKEIEKLSLEKKLENIKFLGSLPRKKIPLLLQYADIGIVTWASGSAFHYVIFNKIFDYMASGLPVLLATEPNDAWRILEASGGGVRVDPENCDLMKEQLVYWAEHPEEAKAMGARGKAYVMKHFMRENLAEQYLELLERIVKEHQ